jgi:hydrogenase nickel incorporation protein HypA/HybF
MHEASLMTSLMNRIKTIAEAENAQRVTSVSVWLGALSHMSEAHFAEHFEHAAAGTIAEAAELDITLSEDTAHANAQDIILEGIEVET